MEGFIYIDGSTVFLNYNSKTKTKQESKSLNYQISRNNKEIYSSVQLHTSKCISSQNFSIFLHPIKIKQRGVSCVLCNAKCYYSAKQYENAA